MSKIISGYAYNIVKRIMPKISATEKAALNSGSVSIDGDIFKGNLELNKIVDRYDIILHLCTFKMPILQQKNYKGK